MLDALHRYPATGIWIEAGLHGECAQLTHGELVERGANVAKHLAALGCRHGDCVACFLPTSPHLLITVVACWQIGAIPFILPDTGKPHISGYAEARIKGILKVGKPRIVVAQDVSLAHALSSSTLPDAKIIDARNLDVPSPISGAVIADASPDDICLLQFSSGSTGMPNGCIIRHKQMVSNFRGISERIKTTSSDRIVSWLPMNHDMGFAAFAMAVFGGIDLHLIPSERFTSNPFTWIKKISDVQGTLSPAPAFAYRLLSKLGKSKHKLNNIDLSPWRYAWVGAEPVYASHILDFNSTFRQVNLSSTALRPAYGMAETVVATTLMEPSEPVQFASVDGQRILDPANTDAFFGYVGCGRPIPGLELKIIDHSGKMCIEGTSGNIFVRGTSVYDGYFGQDNVPQPEGWRDTGDIGFIRGDNIFISGRSKDILIRGGRNFSANDIEAIVENLDPAIRRVVAFSDMRPIVQEEKIIVLVEMRKKSDTHFDLESKIRQSLIETVGISIDSVAFIEPGSIPLTSSGKVRRVEVRELYRNGLHG